MTSFLEKGRFNWGVNLDNMWRYAGAPSPKSIILPYLISVRLPRGPFRLEVNPEDYKSIEEAKSIPAGTEGKESEELCEELALYLKENGIGFVRCWFQWNFFQSKIGSDYHFPLDDFVDSLSKEGINIVAVIGNGYTRFLPQGTELDNTSIYISSITEASREIVRHYKGKIGVWQIENEPNWWTEHFSTHWRSGGIWLEPGFRPELLQRLHDIVREEDPSSSIMINLEADRQRTGWLEYSKLCDIIGLDFYPNYSHADPVDASELKSASSIKAELEKPVMIAETGYPSGPGFLGYTPEKQAKYIDSACKESYSIEALNGLSMWRFSDTYWRSFPEMENHFGLLDKDGDPKPAWGQYVGLVKSLK